MGHLGEALEALFGPDNRFKTVRATLHHWIDYELRSEALAQIEPNSIQRNLKTGKKPDLPKTFRSTTKAWLSFPSHSRIEFCKGVDDSIEKSLFVTNGKQCWECDHEGHVEVCDFDQRNPRGELFDVAIDRHFIPAKIRLFVKELALDDQGPVVTAGRDCVRIRASLRPNARMWPHWLPRESDEFEFHADVKLGVMLKIICRSSGEVFQEYEVLDVAFDEALDPSHFTYTPSPGQQVGPKSPRSEHLTLAGAVARMPFKVLLPTRLPDPEHSHFDLFYHPPQRKESWSHLLFMYRGSKTYARLFVTQAARPYSALDEYEWEAIDDPGCLLKNLRIAKSGEPSATWKVAFEQEGTHVSISSDLERATDRSGEVIRAGGRHKSVLSGYNRCSSRISSRDQGVEIADMGDPGHIT